MSKDAARFVFMTCRAGAESAVKEEVARIEPDWRFSYSRPGFVTFKCAGERPVDERRLAERNWTFAHSHGVSLGRVVGERLAELAASVWNQPVVASLAADGGFAAIHVWHVGRSTECVDDKPYAQPLCDAIDGALRHTVPEWGSNLRATSDIRRPARRNGRVLDVMVLAPGEWWIGYHRAVRRHERWAGGTIPVKLPEHAVSRAYMKMVEALAWSDLPLALGDECVEIGCAPGGASQALLERGLFVTGIDPAEVDPAVLAHPRFRHLKKRGKDVRRKEFEGVRWLVADMNIAPETTLSEVETIVTHPGLAFRGLVLTLKFSDWNLAARLPEFTARVRGWGFRDVRARQLTSGGQEVCLVALKRKALRRVGAKLNRKRKSRPKVTRRKDGSHSTLPGPHF
jgi:23S rRNA (cytidine2498-2'-O)-methyltransferase